MQPPSATTALAQHKARRTNAVIVAMRGEWAKMGADFDASWRTVGPRVTVLLAAAQRGAAHDGVSYVEHVLAETGQSAPLDARPVPESLAGVASDGRDLESLTYGSVVKAKQAVAGGATTTQALTKGNQWLDFATITQIADAVRGGSALSRAARPDVTGYVRTLNGPSCSRCTILAGRWYKWSAGFQRHPRCDCQNIETTRGFTGDAYLRDPQVALAEGKVTDLTIAEKQALAVEGADFAGIINAKLVGRHGNLSHTRVEDILTTTTTHAEAITLLTEHGFMRP